MLIGAANVGCCIKMKTIIVARTAGQKVMSQKLVFICQIKKDVRIISNSIVAGFLL